MHQHPSVCSKCPELAAMIGASPSCMNGVCVLQRLRDIPATILGRPSHSPLVLPTLLSFESPDQEGRTLSLGETVILQKEINTFISVLRRFGILITALHNHWLFDEPRLFYLHWEAIMEPERFVRAVAAAFAAIGEPLGAMWDEGRHEPYEEYDHEYDHNYDHKKYETTERQPYHVEKPQYVQSQPMTYSHVPKRFYEEKKGQAHFRIIQ